MEAGRGHRRLDEEQERQAHRRVFLKRSKRKIWYADHFAVRVAKLLKEFVFAVMTAVATLQARVKFVTKVSLKNEQT